MKQLKQKYFVISEWLFPFGLYLVLACLITWPLITHFQTHLPGSSDDAYMHFWNGWWVQQALHNGQSPFFTKLIFYPDGVNLVTHNFAWFNVLPWLLLEPLLGMIPAYNVTILLNLVLSGFTTYLLARALIKNGRYAFIAGLISIAWPFRLSQLDHPNLLSTIWLPLFLLFLHHTIRQGKWRYAFATGLFFALVGVTRWQQLIPATLMGLIYFGSSYSFWLPKARQFILLRLIGAAGVAFLLLSPAIILLWQQQNNENTDSSVLWIGEEDIMQTDLFAYFTPPPDNLLLGKQTKPLYDKYYPDRYSARRFSAYIGLIALSLSLVGFWWRRVESLPWLLMALVLIFLALGPAFRVNGHIYSEFPTPYRWLEPLTIFRLMRVPDRYNIFLALPVAMIAAYGLKTVGTHWTIKREWLFTGALSVLILFEYASIPAPMRDARPRSPYLLQLADAPKNSPVLNLPFDPLRAKVYMFDQTVHGHPILQGKASRLPDSAYSFIDSQPLLNSLRRVNEIPASLANVNEQLAYLDTAGIDTILVHKTLVGEDRVQHWRRYLLMQPRYEDEVLMAYTTTPILGQDFLIQTELLSNLGLVDTLLSADCTTPGGVLELNTAWGGEMPSNTSLTVVLELKDANNTTQQTQTYPLTILAGTTLSWAYYPLTVSATLPPGAYQLQMAILDAVTGEVAATAVSIAPIIIQSTPCNLAKGLDATPANAVYGNQIRLAAYEVQRVDNRLRFHLYWRAEQRVGINYKFFVHIFDPKTAVPVTQYDAEPRQGAYPTDFWWPGEVVDDRIEIELEGIPVGTYGVAIGVYDGTTGERLLLVDAMGNEVEDGRFILPETIIYP